MIDKCRQHCPNDGSWWENDARGIPLARVCEDCSDEKLSQFRPEVLTDPQYETEEPVESDD